MSATTTTSPHGHQSLPLMGKGIYNTSSVAPSRQIQLFLFLSHSRARKLQLLSGRVFCVGATRPLLKNPGGMALTLKSQPSPHPPTPRLQPDPCPGCQPPTTTPIIYFLVYSLYSYATYLDHDESSTTTPPGGRVYPRTYRTATTTRRPQVSACVNRHHDAQWSWAPARTSTRPPRRLYDRCIWSTTRANTSPNGCIHPRMRPKAHHHPAAVGHSPHCPKHHWQSSALAHANAKTTPHSD